MIAGLAARRYCSRWRASLSSVMSAHAPISFQRLAGVVADDLEGVLDPDVMPVAVAKAVRDGAAALLDQRSAIRQ